MNIVNITLGVDTQPCSSITLGRRGENEVTQVVVDFSSWVEEFGAGVITLLAMRSQDTSAYPVVLTLDGNTATWDVTSTDTAYKGSGRAEYIYTVGEQIAKSVVFNTVVMQDIGEPSETPPDPYEDWLERLTELGAETQANAEAAQQSAEDAAQSVASAEGYAGQAETAAGLAQAAQTASEAARDAAQTSQASAESSATAASGSAASAAGSATAAVGSASDASSSATAAGASASAASASATTASNAATAAQTAQSAAEDAQAAAEQAAQQAHVEYEQLSGEVDDLSDEVSQQKSAIDDLSALVDRKAGMLVDTASGAVASFVPDATINHLLGVTVDVEPVQAGSGDPSPDNVRPISGWDAVEVDSAGENLYSYDATKATTGTTTGGTTRAYYPTGLSNCTLSFSAEVIDSGSVTTVYINIGKLVDGKLSVINGFLSPSGITQGTITFAANEEAVLMAAGPDVSGIRLNLPKYNIMISHGSTAIAYKPYAGNRYTIQLGQTVYGGKLTISEDGSVNALIDRAMVDLGSLSWGIAGQGYRALLNPLPYVPGLVTGQADALCECYKRASGRQIYDKAVDMAFCVSSNYVGNNYVIIGDSSLETAEQVGQALNGKHLVYELATPSTITLDPVTIATISAQTNNVWADAGDVTVEFAADLKSYIDRLNQPTEDDMIANSLIAANKYFTVNNRLFLSTASIAAGAQIIPGTNCTETSLAAALNALNA